MVMILRPNLKTLRDRLRDERSGRVIFVAHCLLNENTRYPGGAYCPGPNPEAVAELMRSGCGIVQMPCPERIAWGGVDKKLVYSFHGIGRNPLVLGAARALLPAYLWALNRRMERVARAVAAEMADYVECGMKVEAVVGLDGSPACGVDSHPDLGAYFEWSARVDPAAVTREEQEKVLTAAAEPGPGVFIEFLMAGMRKRGIVAPIRAFDLQAEREGRKAFPIGA